MLLLGLYLFLISSRGTRKFDAFASRSIGAGLAALGMLFLVIAGLLVLGLVMSICAMKRREQPAWLSRVSLAVHAVAVLAAVANFV